MNLPSQGRITVSPRVTLDILEQVQDNTDVLVHLSNLRGGQIPGKIYHYSATRKPILFILDGTDEEKTLLKDYFSKYERYFFCDNTAESILDAMKTIAEIPLKTLAPVEEFFPESVVKQFI